MADQYRSFPDCDKETRNNMHNALKYWWGVTVDSEPKTTMLAARFMDRNNFNEVS